MKPSFRPLQALHSLVLLFGATQAQLKLKDIKMIRITLLCSGDILNLQFNAEYTY